MDRLIEAADKRDWADLLLDRPLRYYLERSRAVTEAMQRKQHRRWTTADQLLKIYEEAGKLHEAIKDELGDDPKLGELCDVILAGLTMFHVMGCSDRDIAYWLDKTLEKIEVRAL